LRIVIAAMPRSEPDSDGIYRFGNILVEPAAHRLERDGQPLPVEPKAYTLLLTLLRHAGELVSKDTLLDSVWGHHHVTTGVLSRVVSQLRRTLGDSSAQPRYIATVTAWATVSWANCSAPPRRGAHERLTAAASPTATSS
jgi:DNA-binding response OmpR family regulator